MQSSKILHGRLSALREAVVQGKRVQRLQGSMSTTKGWLPLLPLNLPLSAQLGLALHVSSIQARAWPGQGAMCA